MSFVSLHGDEGGLDTPFSLCEWDDEGLAHRPYQPTSVQKDKEPGQPELRPKESRQEGKKIRYCDENQTGMFHLIL